jgi:hypothetical protein
VEYTLAYLSGAMTTKKKKFKNIADSIHGRGGGLGNPDVEEEDDMVLFCF